MISYLKYTVGCCLLALTACQQEVSVPPLEGFELPSALSASLQASFETNPEITAHHFMSTFDRFAKSGPVTHQKVVDFTRMQDALERGRLLGHILALDMNGDGQITRAEFETYSALPEGVNKRLRLEDMFLSDENQDGRMSLTETLLYSRKLHARAATHEMRPIESYLMLFDINGDEEVTRAEMKRHLFDLFPIRDAKMVGPTRGSRRASPN